MSTTVPPKIQKVSVDLIAFRALRAKADTYYRNLKPVHCPYLKGQVKFTADGWHHLRYDGSRSERPKVIQAIKFRLLLNYVADTIRGGGNLQYYREMLQPVGHVGRDGLRRTSTVRYFAFEALDIDKRIRFRVVVRKIGEGEPHFWSVMPRWKYKKEGKTKQRTAGENVAALEDE